jgi:N-acetylglucosamine-6-sulfatase
MLRKRAARGRPAASALALLLAVALASSGPAATPAAAGGAQRPNVIVVLTDDQSVAEMNAETMPRTMAAIAGHGTSFESSVVSSPLCCPSRAGFLTGEYPHNSGVFDNEPGYAALIDKPSTIYPWLQAAGYRTGHVGRFLLNYDRATPPGGDWETDGGFAPPPGLDDWFGYVGAATLYHGATFSDNGASVVEGRGKPGYTTRVMNRQALEFIDQARSDPRPYFLMLAHVAPHAAQTTGPGPCGVGGLPIPDGGKLGRWSDAPLPKPPSFDEANVADKPNWIRTRPHLGHRRRAGLKLGWRCANASLSTVDDGVAQIVRELRHQGELDRTAIFVTSDNGYLFGEHRVFLNKVYPYEEALRVPLLARLPPALAGRHGQPAQVPALVNNLDLTATILDLAGASPCTAAGDCRTLDGRSLLPLLEGRKPDWVKGRALLFQIGQNRTCGELPERGLHNFYDAVRTRRFVYIEHNRVNPETGACDRPEYELYDLKQDPYQLRSIAVNPAQRAPSPRQASLARRLAALRDCAGIEGRDPAAGRPYCD